MTTLAPYDNIKSFMRTFCGSYVIIWDELLASGTKYYDMVAHDNIRYPYNIFAVHDNCCFT